MYKDRAAYPEMPTLTESFLENVQSCARAGMTKDEILAAYSLNAEDMTLTEKCYFNEKYAFGRGAGIKYMGEQLFNHAKTKNGLPAALAYLRIFTSEYEKVDSTQASSAENFSFIFKN